MRLSDKVSAKVEAAIADLPILQVEKDTIDHEVVPLLHAGLLKFWVSVCLPIPGTDDQVNEPGVLEDAYSAQPVVNSLVRGLYTEAQAKIDTIRLQKSPAYGKGPSGLIIAP